jgi:transcriptional antiterminator NusG
MSETGTTAKQWFVVHTYSGFENKVASGIESRAKIFGLQDMIGRCLLYTLTLPTIRLV